MKEKILNENSEFNKIIIYEKPKKIIVTKQFTAYYIDYNEHDLPFMESKVYQVDELLYAIAKVKSPNCRSGYGYIVYLEDIDNSLLFDLTLFKE